LAELIERNEPELYGIYQLCLHAAIAVWDPILCEKILTTCFDSVQNKPQLNHDAIAFALSHVLQTD
jgi:hypothetical protein